MEIKHIFCGGVDIWFGEIFLSHFLDRGWWLGNFVDAAAATRRMCTRTCLQSNNKKKLRKTLMWRVDTVSGIIQGINNRQTVYGMTHQAVKRKLGRLKDPTVAVWKKQHLHRNKGNLEEEEETKKNITTKRRLTEDKIWLLFVKSSKNILLTENYREVGSVDESDGIRKWLTSQLSAGSFTFFFF